MSTTKSTLREIRRERGLSQRDLAALAHVQLATVSNAETGRHTPCFKTRQKLARALNTPVQKIEFGQRLEWNWELIRNWPPKTTGPTEFPP